MPTPKRTGRTRSDFRCLICQYASYQSARAVLTVVASPLLNLLHVSTEGGGVCTLTSTPEVGAKTSPLNGLVGNYNSNHLARAQIKQRQPKLHVGFTQKHQEIKCSFSIFNHLFVLLFLYKIEQNTVTLSLRRTPLGPALSVRLREVSVL